MTSYDIMYEAINDKYENGEITFEQANELNEMAYDRYITEKKTKANYRIQKFKKKFNYDPIEKTVDINGEKIPFNLKANEGNKYRKQAEANYKSSRTDPTVKGTITMNRRAFMDKDPKSHEFILGHEYGHYVAKKMTPEEKEKEFEKYKDHTLKVKKAAYHVLNNRVNTLDSKESKENFEKFKKEKDLYNNLDKYGFDDEHDAQAEEYFADKWGAKLAGEKTAKRELKDMQRSGIKAANDLKASDIKHGFSNPDPRRELKYSNNTLKVYKDLEKKCNTDKQREFVSSKIKEIKDQQKDIKKKIDHENNTILPLAKKDANTMYTAGTRERIKNISSNKKK